VDETFIGRSKAIKPKGEKKGRGFQHKHKILALVDRDTGKARSIVLDDLKQSTLLLILRGNIANQAVVGGVSGELDRVDEWMIRAGPA